MPSRPTAARSGAAAAGHPGARDGFHANPSAAPVALAPRFQRLKDEAQRVYLNHGTEAVDLGPARTGHTSVRDLVRRSPQIDPYSADQAGNDVNRCGGAAVLNAMLLQGSYRENAAAIRTVLGTGAEGNRDEALQQMAAGRLSPYHAAVLQEGLYEAGTRGAPRTATNREQTGMSRDQMTALVTALTNAGGFPNGDVTLTNAATRDGDLHWTTTVATATGPVTASSLPERGGYSSVREQAAPTRSSRGFEAEVTVRARQVASSRPD